MKNGASRFITSISSMLCKNQNEHCFPYLFFRIQSLWVFEEHSKIILKCLDFHVNASKEANVDMENKFQQSFNLE